MKSSETINPYEDSNLILFKGDPTTRKTANLGSYIKAASDRGKKSCVFDIDGKIGSIMKAHPGLKFDYDYYSADDFMRFNDDFSGLQKMNPYEGGVIAIDSLLSLSKMTMRYSIIARGEERNSKGRMIGGVSMNTLEDYGFEQTVFDNVISIGKILSKKSTVIFIAHVIATEKEINAAGEEVIFRSLLTGGKKVAKGIPAQFKEIYHFYYKSGLMAGSEGEYIVRTQNSGHDFACTMMPLPKEINVTKCDLYQKIQEAVKTKEVKL